MHGGPDLAVGVDFAVPDHPHIDVCSQGLGPEVRGRHQDAAGAHKRIVDQVALLYLQTQR